MVIAENKESEGKESQPDLVTIKPDEVDDEAAAETEAKEEDKNHPAPVTIQAKADTDSVLMPRPAARAVLTILVALILVNSVGALALAVKSTGSVFWRMINDKNRLSFSVIGAVFGLLLTVAILGIGLTVSTYFLLIDPQGVFRWYGALISLFQSIFLLIFGITQLFQSYNISADVALLCEGGFPQMDLIADVFINKFAEIEFQYVQRYMCIPDACPCNTRVNPATFGDR